MPVLEGLEARECGHGSGGHGSLGVIDQGTDVIQSWFRSGKVGWGEASGGVDDGNVSSRPQMSPCSQELLFPGAKNQERHSVFGPWFPHLSNGAVIVLGCGVCN